jgi:hypothetical protein
MSNRQKYKHVNTSLQLLQEHIFCEEKVVNELHGIMQKAQNPFTFLGRSRELLKDVHEVGERFLKDPEKSLLWHVLDATDKKRVSPAVGMALGEHNIDVITKIIRDLLDGDVKIPSIRQASIGLADKRFSDRKSNDNASLEIEAHVYYNKVIDLIATGCPGTAQNEKDKSIHVVIGFKGSGNWLPGRSEEELEEARYALRPKLKSGVYFLLQKLDFSKKEQLQFAMAHMISALRLRPYNEDMGNPDHCFEWVRSDTKFETSDETVSLFDVEYKRPNFTIQKKRITGDVSFMLAFYSWIALEHALGNTKLEFLNKEDSDSHDITKDPRRMGLRRHTSARRKSQKRFSKIISTDKES